MLGALVPNMVGGEVDDADVVIVDKCVLHQRASAMPLSTV
jgi:hypothetical protein